jgi:hypothetical protein
MPGECLARVGNFSAWTWTELLQTLIMVRQSENNLSCQKYKNKHHSTYCVPFVLKFPSAGFPKPTRFFAETWTVYNVLLSRSPSEQVHILPLLFVAGHLAHLSLLSFLLTCARYPVIARLQFIVGCSQWISTPSFAASLFKIFGIPGNAV